MATIESEYSALRGDPRAFACPGLYRIVRAKDGGICRVRVPLGILSSAQARAVGRAAVRYGNGIVETTNRANFQIRGIEAADERLFIAELADAGLAPRESWADDTRNVLINPMAGHDPGELVDVRPIARHILDRLSDDRVFSVLSPKFSLQIDGGGALSVADHAHDIWLVAVQTGEGPMFRVGLGGALDYDGKGADIRLVAADACGEAVFALIADFLDSGMRRHGVVRMRQLVELSGADAIWRRAEARLGRVLATTAPGVRATAVGTTQAPLGAIVQREIDLRALGVAPVLGRIDADGLEALAQAADTFGRGDIRLSPWRSFLIPNVPARAADDAIGLLADAGLVCDADDPRSRLIACAGCTGCASGKADVKADARRLADLLGPSADRASIHLSGCAKSCAVPGTADVTLVAVSHGIYDLYCRDAGEGGRFGALLARGIDLDGAAKRIAGAGR